MQNRTLIVLGMHRSGTSLTTRWLHKCGLPVGENLLGPGLGNKEGHFEDTAFYNVHLKILQDNGLHDSGILTEPVDQIKVSRIKELKQIIADKNRRFEQWGWKDPRTCLFPELYRELIPNAYYLVVLRDYQSVIISLLNRTFALKDITYNTQKGYFSRLAWHTFRRKRQYKKFCREQASFFLKVWIHYNESILTYIRSLPADKYLVINYTILLKDDERIISHLNNSWHLSLNYSSFSAICNEKLFSKPFKVDHFINNDQLIKMAEDLFVDLSSFVSPKSVAADREFLYNESVTKVI